MKHAFLSRRHRNPHQHDEQQKQQPFFSKSKDTESLPFFTGASHGEPVQTKLAIGQPGDKYEKEADAEAEHVVSGENKTAVQRQDISAIQRAELKTPQEEEKPGTAEARIEQDKLVQEKPEAQIQTVSTGGMEERKEKPVQMQSASTGAKEERKEKPVQMQSTSTGATEEKKEKPVQMQPASTAATEEKKEKPVQVHRASAGATEERKEKPVQMQQASAQATKEKEKKIRSMAASNSPRLQRKSESSVATASPHLSNRIQDSTGKGKSLPRKTRAEMGNAMGRDFSAVNIHTDAGAAQMNEELGAHAFAHGSDVYFNSGKYNPESQDGKRLLAHELTHVVQQTGTDQISPYKPKTALDVSAADGSRKKKQECYSFDGSTKVRDALFAIGDFETADKQGDSTLSELAIKLNGNRLPEAGAVIEGNTYYFHVVATEAKRKQISIIKLIKK